MTPETDLEGHPTERWCATCGDWMPAFIDVEPLGVRPGPPFCNRCGVVFTPRKENHDLDD